VERRIVLERRRGCNESRLFWKRHQRKCQSRALELVPNTAGSSGNSRAVLHKNVQEAQADGRHVLVLQFSFTWVDLFPLKFGGFSQINHHASPFDSRGQFRARKRWSLFYRGVRLPDCRLKGRKVLVVANGRGGVVEFREMQPSG
jgi:hypothetical protein